MVAGDGTSELEDETGSNISTETVLCEIFCVVLAKTEISGGGVIMVTVVGTGAVRVVE